MRRVATAKRLRVVLTLALASIFGTIAVGIISVPIACDRWLTEQSGTWHYPEFARWDGIEVVRARTIPGRDTSYHITIRGTPDRLQDVIDYCDAWTAEHNDSIGGTPFGGGSVLFGVHGDPKDGELTVKYGDI